MKEQGRSKKKWIKPTVKILSIKNTYGGPGTSTESISSAPAS